MLCHKYFVTHIHQKKYFIMEMIKIKTSDYYNRPEYYPYMPEEIFSALELAELEGVFNDSVIEVSVSKKAFDEMIHEYNKDKKQ